MVVRHIRKIDLSRFIDLLFYAGYSSRYVIVALRWDKTSEQLDIGLDPTNNRVGGLGCRHGNRKCEEARSRSACHHFLLLARLAAQILAGILVDDLHR